MDLVINNMRVVFLSILVLACIGIKAQISDSNKHFKNAPVINKVQVNVLRGQPISFFLNHSGIDINSKKVYKGEKSIHEENILNGIMDSLISCGVEVRPFYFFIFNQIVDLSNGDQEERVARVCKEFIENYPCDLFYSFNQPELNINVVKWTTYIGLTLRDRANYIVFKNNVDSKIKTNCADIQDLLKSFMAEVRMCLLR